MSPLVHGVGEARRRDLVAVARRRWRAGPACVSSSRSWPEPGPDRVSTRPVSSSEVGSTTRAITRSGTPASSRASNPSAVYTAARAVEQQPRVRADHPARDRRAPPAPRPTSAATSSRPWSPTRRPTASRAASARPQVEHALGRIAAAAHGPAPAAPRARPRCAPNRRASRSADAHRRTRRSAPPSLPTPSAPAG